MPYDKLLLVSSPGRRSWVRERFLSGPRLAAEIERELEKDRELARQWEAPLLYPKQRAMLSDPRPLTLFGGSRGKTDQ